MSRILFLFFVCISRSFLFLGGCVKERKGVGGIEGHLHNSPVYCFPPKTPERNKIVSVLRLLPHPPPPFFCSKLRSLEEEGVSEGPRGLSLTTL